MSLPQILIPFLILRFSHLNLSYPHNCIAWAYPIASIARNAQTEQNM
jgi:hypothetical protein